MNDGDIRTILVAVDGSRNSLVAAGVAARLGRILHAGLCLVHIMEAHPLNFWAGLDDRMKADIRAEAERMLADISRQIDAACEFMPSYHLAEGPPEEEICRLAQSRPGVLMVVVGRHGVSSEKHSRLSRPYCGELVRKLTGRLSVPLLTVPADVNLPHICPNLSDIAMPGDSPGN